MDEDKSYVELLETKDKVDENSKKIQRAYLDVFDLNSPQVVEVLRDMCNAHGVFDGGFDLDPYMHAFNSGERNVVLRILTVVKMNIEDIINLPDRGGL